LQKDLHAFNERIAELENEGHRGHAMEVLKANAIDFARQIDELRCLLVASAPKDALNGEPPGVTPLAVLHPYVRPCRLHRQGFAFSRRLAFRLLGLFFEA
jgi:hypothetical protein